MVRRRHRWQSLPPCILPEDKVVESVEKRLPPPLSEAERDTAKSIDNGMLIRLSSLARG
jgi:hypothetical protein